ncbi:hypothetical protein BGZ73_002087 [Actinomortierella ambigua]|nr:hypothetical protein BGZ73_002087 [Actinomortierella ambigua]
MDYKVAQACLDAAFPFPTDNFKKTIESVRKLISQSYVFEDLAANPPQVDGLTLQEAAIVQNLNDLDAYVHGTPPPEMSPRAFHTAISDILIRARDAHLAYRVDCFEKFQFDFGFLIGQEWDSVTLANVLKVQATLPSFKKLSSLNFSPDGCEVTTIDGRPAHEFIDEWASEHIDVSKDANVRYNRALSRPFFEIGPTEDGSLSSFEWTDETDEELLRAQAERILRAMPVEEQVPNIPLFDQTKPLAASRYRGLKADASDYRILLESNLGLHALLLADGKTGVITIPTFHPPGVLGYVAYYNTLLEAIDLLRPVAERLILDVTNNGGGYVCLARQFVQVFFPDTPEVVTNIRYSDLESEIIKTGQNNYFVFHIPSQGEDINLGYITTQVTHENRDYTFTNYLNEGCQDFPRGQLQVDPAKEALRPRSQNKGYVYDPEKPYYPWDAEDIIIFSDGYCGSSCAFFTNQLQLKNNVRAVVYGGKPDTQDPFSYSSFPGLEVLTADRYFEYYRAVQSMRNLNGASAGLQSDGTKEKPNPATSTDEGQDTVHYCYADDGACTTSGGEAEGEEGDSNKPFTAQLTRDQLDRLSVLLPEPFQHKADMTFTWRQIYNTGNVRELFVFNEVEQQWVPNWGPDIAKWREFSFLPATYRLPITRENYELYHTLWENARDLVWDGTGTTALDVGDKA